MIMAGTGAGGFLGRWFVHINDRLVVRGIDNLHYHTRDNLASMWPGFKEEFSLTAPLLPFIILASSEATGLIRSFAYRSTNSFQSEQIEYGLGIKPECTIPETYRLPKDIRRMMDEQRTKQEPQQEGQRVYIGGEIHIHHLSQDGFQVYTLDRFEDYELDEKGYLREPSPCKENDMLKQTNVDEDVGKKTAARLIVGQVI
jgi:hypothetical protein